MSELENVHEREARKEALKRAIAERQAAMEKRGRERALLDADRDTNINRQAADTARRDTLRKRQRALVIERADTVRAEAEKVATVRPSATPDRQPSVTVTAAPTEIAPVPVAPPPVRAPDIVIDAPNVPAPEPVLEVAPPPAVPVAMDHIEPIVPSSLDAAAVPPLVVAEIKNMTESKREKLNRGLFNLGYFVREGRDHAFIAAINKVAHATNAEKSKGWSAYLGALRTHYEKDRLAAETARMRGQDTWRNEAGSVGSLLGMVGRYGRTLADVAGVTPTAAGRYVMLGAMIGEQQFNAFKEMRLAPREREFFSEEGMLAGLIEKTKARVASERQIKPEEVTGEMITQEDIQQTWREVLDKPSVTWKVGELVARASFQKSLPKFVQRWQAAQTLEEQSRLFEEYQDTLHDLERAMDKSGEIDTLTSFLRLGKHVSTATARVMVAASLGQLLKFGLEHLGVHIPGIGTADVVHPEAAKLHAGAATPGVTVESGGASPGTPVPKGGASPGVAALSVGGASPGFLESSPGDLMSPGVDHPTMGGFTPGVESPTETVLPSVHDQSLATPVPEAPVASSAWLTKEGFNVEGDHVSVEIGSGNVHHLDQALRRLAVENMPSGYVDDKVLSELEADRMENVIGNLRELLDGHKVAGMSPIDLKGVAQFKGGKLEILDPTRFHELTDRLFQHADETITKPIGAASRTVQSVWNRLLEGKLGAGRATAEHFATKMVEAPAPVVISPDAISDNVALPSEAEIASGAAREFAAHKKLWDIPGLRTIDGTWEDGNLTVFDRTYHVTDGRITDVHERVFNPISGDFSEGEELAHDPDVRLPEDLKEVDTHRALHAFFDKQYAEMYEKMSGLDTNHPDLRGLGANHKDHKELLNKLADRQPLGEVISQTADGNFKIGSIDVKQAEWSQNYSNHIDKFLRENPPGLIAAFDNPLQKIARKIINGITDSERGPTLLTSVQAGEHPLGKMRLDRFIELHRKWFRP